MGRSADYSNEKCAIAGALYVVGEPWTLLIIRDAFRGFSRFEQWQKNTGIARNVLAARLKRLVATGIMHTRPYHQKPLRHEYLLTERGQSLKGVILALYGWGQEHVYKDRQPVLTLRHRQTAETLRPRIYDEGTGSRICLQDILFDYNPHAPSLAELYAETDSESMA